MISNQGKKIKIVCSFIILFAIAVMPLVGISDSSAQAAEALQGQEAPRLSPPQQPLPPRTGGRPPQMDLSHLKGDKMPEGVGAAALPPSTWDWRTTGKVTPVKDQGDCGSCYAFAAIGNIESKMLIDGAAILPDPDYSEDNAKECNWRELNDYESPPGNPWGSCDGGNYYMLASLFSQKGVVLESCDPYVASDVDCNDACPYQKTLLDWRIISANAVPNTDVLKSYIQTYGPVYTMMYADSSQGFDNSYDGSYTFNYTTPPASGVNHCVLIVGWSNDLPPVPGGTEPADGWIVKNSWGPTWGANGYFYITYGSANIGMYSSFMYDWQDYDNNGGIMYYDDDCWSDSWGWSPDTTAWGLAKFFPSSDTYITRVEFWTTDKTTDVDIYIYDDFDGTTLSNLLWSSLNHSFNEAGYHGVVVDPPLAVTSGDDVIAVVKFTNDSYGYPIPVDGNGPFETGRTYRSHTGANGTWYDFGGVGSDAAIRLRTSQEGGEKPLPYFDDMESGPNGWTATGFWHQITNAQTIYVYNVAGATPEDPPNDINPDLVTLPDTDASGHAYLPSAYSGNTAWWYGVDDNGTFIDDPFDLSIQYAKNGGYSTEPNSGSLTSPVINLTGVSAATLNLKTWWEIEGVDADVFDMMYVEISTDGGATFSEIGSLNPLNDVNNESYQNYSSGGSNAVPVWVNSQFDLTLYATYNVQLRFTFETVDNLYNGFRGWFIDDVSVTAGGLLPPEVTDVEPDCIDDPTTILVITGTNFANGATVDTGGVPAADSAVISTSSIHALIDPSLGYGTYDVTVTNPDGASDTLPNAFTYAASCVGFVDVLSVDAAEFCKIWVYVSVDTDAGKAGSLTQDNFEVYEDDVLQTIESFESSGEGSKADILFVFDDTGSMGGEIGTMKTECKGLTDAIEAAGIDARYALVSFGDVPEVDLNWTSDAAAFKSAVDALSAWGGGDLPEDNLDAIEMGLGLGFRAAAQKIIIDITDDHTHYKGDGSGFAEYTMPEVADDLISYGVTLFVVSPDFGTMTATTDNQGMTVPLTSASTDNQRKPIAPLTSSATEDDKKVLAADVGGVWMDINAADFAEILDSIVGTITTAYHIDYTTTNCVEDCTNRTVKITVHDPVQGTDSDTGTYKAPCECQDNPDVAVGLASLGDKLVVAYGYKASEGGWTWYNPSWPPGANTLTTLYAGRGYWLNVSEACNLVYGDNTYELDAAWNLIAWLGC